MRYLILFLFPLSLHAADFRFGIGYALNNNSPVREEVQAEGFYKGQTVDASAVFKSGQNDIQISWTYFMHSDFGTEQMVTAAMLRKYGRAEVGGGLILGYQQAYETWQKDHVSPDPVRPRQCVFCGIMAQAGYNIGKAQVQLRYYRTDFNFYPGHNGALALLAWSF